MYYSAPPCFSIYMHIIFELVGSFHFISFHLGACMITTLSFHIHFYSNQSIKQSSNQSLRVRLIVPSLSFLSFWSLRACMIPTFISFQSKLNSKGLYYLIIFKLIHLFGTLKGLVHPRPLTPINLYHFIILSLKGLYFTPANFSKGLYYFQWVRLVGLVWFHPLNLLSPSPLPLHLHLVLYL